MIFALTITMSVSGLIATYLAVIKNSATNFLLLLGVGVRFYLYLLLGLYADMLNELIVTLPLTILAILSWSSNIHVSVDNELVVKEASNKQRFVVTAVALLLWALLYLVMRNFQSTLTGINTLIVVMCGVYLWCHAKAYREAWILSIAVCLLYILQYMLLWGYNVGGYIIYMTNIIYIIMSVKGYISWGVSGHETVLEELDT